MNNNTNPSRHNYKSNLEGTLVYVLVSLLKKLIFKTSEPKTLGIKLCLDS